MTMLPAVATTTPRTTQTLITVVLGVVVAGFVAVRGLGVHDRARRLSTKMQPVEFCLAIVRRTPQPQKI